MPLNSPDIKELKSIVDWVNLTDDVRELSIKFGDVELFISRDRRRSDTSGVPATVPAAPSAVEVPVAPAHVAVAAAVTPASAANQDTSAETLAPGEVMIKAPMVGTYYASPKPGSPAFVTVGDTVTSETVLCIVEVMKLMNNIEAKVNGTVTKILVDDNQAVQYGQPLMIIKTVA
jgi:acetyl-CoA carboxylase biotin carboxyl carrier protein